jgi:hypothetical protein
MLLLVSTAVEEVSTRKQRFFRMPSVANFGSPSWIVVW